MMRFTMNNKVQRPAVAARSIGKRPAVMTKPRVIPQPRNPMGAMFQNMVDGKYRSSGCSSCSGAR